MAKLFQPLTTVPHSLSTIIYVAQIKVQACPKLGVSPLYSGSPNLIYPPPHENSCEYYN